MSQSNPLPEATPDELVRQLLSLVGIEQAIRLLRDEDQRRTYASIATQD